jgi:hypothetical protein
MNDIYKQKARKYKYKYLKLKQELEGRGDIYKQKARKYKYLKLKQELELEGGGGILWTSRPKDVRSLIEQANSKPMMKGTPINRICGILGEFELVNFFNEIEITPNATHYINMHNDIMGIFKYPDKVLKKQADDLITRMSLGQGQTRYMYKKNILSQQDYDNLDLDNKDFGDLLTDNEYLVYAGTIENNEKNCQIIKKYFNYNLNKLKNYTKDDNYFGFQIIYYPNQFYTRKLVKRYEHNEIPGWFDESDDKSN